MGITVIKEAGKYIAAGLFVSSWLTDWSLRFDVTETVTKEYYGYLFCKLFVMSCLY